MSYGVIMTNYTIMDYKKYIYSLGTALSGARGRHRRGRCKVIGSPNWPADLLSPIGSGDVMPMAPL